MISAPLAINENERLKELEYYNILDSEVENDYNKLVELASVICDTPISLVSLVDNHRQWFKASVGLSVRETPKDIAFCSHALLQDELFLINDASKDERFYDNPLVTSNPNIRFYAGMPLKSPKGFNLGSLCVIDTVPRDLTESQIIALKVLSKQVINLFELRRKNIDLENTLAKLKRTNELKNKLFSIISHDLKTPMSNIDMFLQILEGDMLSLEESKEHLSSLRVNLKITDGLMNNLFNWAKSQMNNFVFNQEKHDIKLIIDDEISRNEFNIKQKNLNVINNLSENTFLYIEKNQFSYIIRNLLHNAIKFTENGVIEFSSEINGDFLDISIKDSGIGMADETIEKLFSWDKKNSKKGTKGESGSGFGLLVVNDFVKNHNGNILVKSELQIGTNVIISFPILNDNSHEGNLE